MTYPTKLSTIHSELRLTGIAFDVQNLAYQRCFLGGGVKTSLPAQIRITARVYTVFKPVYTAHTLRFIYNKSIYSRLLRLWMDLRVLCVSPILLLNLLSIHIDYKYGPQKLF